MLPLRPPLSLPLSLPPSRVVRVVEEVALPVPGRATQSQNHGTCEHGEEKGADISAGIEGENRKDGGRGKEVRILDDSRPMMIGDVGNPTPARMSMY